MINLAGQHAIITGGTRGIGAGIARTMRAAGAQVTLSYHQDAGAAAALVRELGGEEHAQALAADVRDQAAMEALFAAATARFGAPTIVVNNAGVYSFGPLKRFEEAEYRRLFDTNVLGVLHGTRLAAQHFGAAGGVVIRVRTH
jgi:3-oxoacyl-[acyl-carrier protein] reductase